MTLNSGNFCVAAIELLKNFKKNQKAISGDLKVAAIERSSAATIGVAAINPSLAATFCVAAIELLKKILKKSKGH
jgi:hypothetical protein